LVGISRVAGCLYRCHTALKSKAEKKKMFGVALDPVASELTSYGA
jgi:hypothetical protein